MILSTVESTAHIFQIVVDSSGNFVNRYAEINNIPVDGQPYPSGKQTIHVNCPIRSNGRMQVVLASELTAPEFLSFEIVLN
jgi:hypothetical protein